ncbi:MAG: Tn3 family transposase [Chlorobium sp.]|nr:Tn3 family transposase [Chlorobium sp.]
MREVWHPDGRTTYAKLYIPGKANDYPALEKLIGGKLNIKHLRSHWNDILRLTTSI